MSGGKLWRVGHRADPLAFTPFELCAWNHRFDDARRRHASLLIEHGLAHLDLHEITARRRVVTQTIAADLFDRCNAGALRFPSRLDGQPALAVFEGRGELVEAGDPVALTDPAPAALLAVCREWGLELEPTAGL